jgi:hypothetical protein
MIGDSDDEVGHKETDSPHGLTIEPLLKPAGGEDNFIRIMDMNDPPSNRYSPRGQKIDGADNVMVAVQDVILAPPQLHSQSSNKLRFTPDRNR